MPKRKITIHEQPNPTGLTMAERMLALNVLRSLEDAVTKERPNMKRGFRWRRHDRCHSCGSDGSWTPEDEQELRRRVYRAAYNQLTGRQKTETGVFQFKGDVAVPDVDMDYVRKSLGIA